MVNLGPPNPPPKYINLAKNTINKGQGQAQPLQNKNQKCRGNPLRLPIITGLWKLGGGFGLTKQVVFF